MSITVQSKCMTSNKIMLFYCQEEVLEQLFRTHAQFFLEAAGQRSAPLCALKTSVNPISKAKSSVLFYGLRLLNNTCQLATNLDFIRRGGGMGKVCKRLQFLNLVTLWGYSRLQMLAA